MSYMTNKNSISLKLTPAVADELEQIARQVGFDSSEDLLKVYIREVIIASRIEQATANLRDTIRRGSSDLDDLEISRQNNTTKTTSE